MFRNEKKKASFPVLNIAAWKKFRYSKSYYSQLKKLHKINEQQTSGAVAKTINSNNNISLNIPPPSGFVAVPKINIANTIIFNSNFQDEGEGFNNIDADAEDDDDEDDEDDVEEKKYQQMLNYKNELQNWTTTHNITHTALSHLLKLQNEYLDLNLPMDARTLLHTPVNIKVIEFKDGLYWHQGLKVCLTNYFSEILEPLAITLNINMDGLPLFKSSKQQFWPILANIYEFNHLDPFVIGLYCGFNKPSSVEGYLQPFVTELLDVIQNGVTINGSKISIKIRCFICDSPARAFIKGVKNFNAIHGCIKCEIEGIYCRRSFRLYYPVLPHYVKRTDEKFRKNTYVDHYQGKEKSPLQQLPIDMINSFIIADTLHLIDLGVMKNFLIGWRFGKFNGMIGKWRADQILEISEILQSIKMPKEIHRSVRGLNDINYWKGTEFRTFFFYISIVILSDYLPPELFNNFLLLYCSITICSSSFYLRTVDIATSMLNSFVKQYAVIYGKDAVTSNIHNLVHLTEDVKTFGPLETISAYPFENKLYQIKKLLRKGNHALVQAAKRIHEAAIATTWKKNKYNKKYPVFKKLLKNDGPQEFYSEVEVIGNLTFSTKIEDRWFLTKQNEIVQVAKATLLGKKIKIYGYKMTTSTTDVFHTPLKSSSLSIYQVKEDFSLMNNLKQYDVDDIKCKLVAVHYKLKNKYVFIPLIHTIDMLHKTN